MSKRPTAFFDEEGVYLAGKSTVLVLDPKSGISLKVLECILNSKVIALVYQALFSGLALSGGYLRFGPPQLEVLPIPRSMVCIKPDDVRTESDVCALYGVSEAEVNEAFTRVCGENGRTSTDVEIDG
jgi:hypothetical protein